MSSVLQDLQRCILRPEAIVNYPQIVNSYYPPEAFNEPFVGFKVGLLDVVQMQPQQRFDQLFNSLPSILNGTNVIVREVPITAPNGFYLITLPVPRSRVMDSINGLKRVIGILEQRFGLVPTKEYQINVSGKCNVYDTETKMQSIFIPDMYQRFMVVPPSGAYRVGQVQRLNNEFLLVRTDWLFEKRSSVFNDIDHVNNLTHLISSIF